MPKTFSLVVVIARLLSSAGYAAEPSGRIIGKVTVEKSGEPVPGATIMALTGMSQDRPGRQYANGEARTNDKGEYELIVPFGNIWLEPPQPPAGFWNNDAKPLDQFVITRKVPTVKKDFTMKKGAVWDLKLESGTGKPIQGANILVSVNSNTSWRNVTNARGEGSFTVPSDGREAKLVCAVWPFSERKTPILPSNRVTLDVAEDFNAQAAKFINRPQPGKPVELVDDHRRKAVIDGCTVVLEDGRPKLRLVAEEPGEMLKGDIVGKVVDSEGRPVKGAEVSCLHPLLLAPNDICQTNVEGAFHFLGFFKWIPTNEKPGFALMVLKDGCVGVELGRGSEFVSFTPNSAAIHQLERPLVLKPGYSARLRILAPSGEPVEGAWVEPNGDLSARAQFAKSDRDGYCTVRNLPEGVTRLDVNYGNLSAGAKVVLSASSASEEPVTIRLTKTPDFAQQELPKAAPAPKPIKPGEIAPEWSIKTWTDGKDRKRSDFRGKIVLVDFWGVWCGGCVQAIPALKKVHEKFGDQVVFIGIHTPGTEVSQIKKLLGLKNWDVQVGVDTGPDEGHGETAGRYGVYGYPTFIVIDKQGRIAFNPEAEDGAHDRDKVMVKMKAMAEEIGIPWPIDKDVSEENAFARLERMQIYMLSKEIEKALKD